MPESHEKLPQPTAKDYAFAAAKGAIAGLPIPVIANAAAEFLGMLLLPPMSKRRDEWLQGLYNSLKSLESKLAGFELDQLAKNETFVSAALQASQAAVRTHERKKLEALHSAVVNVAAGRTSDEDTNTFFLSLIDTFSATHLEILKYFSDRTSFPADRRTELEQRRAITDPIVLDLNARGMLEDHRPFVGRARESFHAEVNGSWTLSNIGTRFLQFISQQP